MERGGHADRRQVGRAVAAGADLIEIGEVRDLAQMADAAGMDHGGADIVDQLVLDQFAAIMDRVEDLAHGQRRGGVLADQLERVLIFRRGRIFQPEGAILFQILAQATGLDRGQAMMDVVQQMHVPAQRLARSLEQFGDDAEIFAGVPDIFGRQVGVGGFVEIFVLRHAIGRRHAGDAALDADRLVALGLIFQRDLDRILDRRAIGMAIDHDAFPAGAAE